MNLLRKLLDKAKNSINPKELNEFRGFFESWEEAKNQTLGYSAEEIFNKATEAALRVKGGEAIFERDTVLFSEKVFNWPLLATLFDILSKDGKANVIDFGGGLASTYVQHQEHFTNKEINWLIVEQARYVEFGNQHLTDLKVKFFHTIEQCVEETDVNVILFSSVLQYLPEPFLFLAKVKSLKIDHIVLDRTRFFNSEHSRISMQVVPKIIYEGSYPVWFFNQDEIVNKLSPEYKIKYKFKSYCDEEKGIVENVEYSTEGIYLERQTNT